MKDYDVALVGYGPTGMTLAALLGQMGHSVVVLERYSGLYNLPRAACFDDQTMRLFQRLGLVEAISEGVVPQGDYQWVNAAGETLVDLRYASNAPGGWAAMYMMFQPEIETALDRHDKALPGVDIHQGITVSAVEQDGETVTLRGAHENGEAIAVRARYAVGSDGGGSFLRRTLAPEVEDYGFQENWLVCDFHMLRAVPTLPIFQQVCDPVQPISIVRIGPHHHRFSFMLEPGESPEKATAPDAVWARVSRYIMHDDAELIRAVNYVFRSRIVRDWRHGRVFLAGDAAHEMPPFLGQGMCSGIRDSHNLAWKLDLVLTGRADDSLLDTYQSEREPHVRFITEKAIELGRVQTLRDPEQVAKRDERLLALRRANQAPEKVVLPGLTAGFVAGNESGSQSGSQSGSGAYFPQGHVRSHGTEGRFDDVVGSGWCIVATEPALLHGLTDAQRSAWEAIGGRVAVVTTGSTDGALEDRDGTYAAWFELNGCSVAVVRPDWYVYGTARDGAGLTVLLDRMVRSLHAQPA